TAFMMVGFSAMAADGTSSSYSDTNSGADGKAVPRMNLTAGMSSSKLTVNDDLITDQNNQRADIDGRKNDVAASLTFDLGSGPVVLETGAAYRSFGLKINDNAHINLDYIGVPVMAKFYLGDVDTTAFFIRAGVRPSWAIGKSVEIGSLRTGGNPGFGVKNFDLPAVAGVGAKLAMGPQFGLLVSADYERSITKINEFGGDDVHNDALVFQAGLSIGL
ncbi:MAG: PorT family protein, partial [Proteobacteria bacterium]